MKLTSWAKNTDQYHHLIENRGFKLSPYATILIPAMTDYILSLTKSNSKILDFGCGEGYLSRKIALNRKNIFGCDISPSLIHEAQRKEKTIHYWVQNIEKPLNLNKNIKFNLAYTNLMFPYISHPQRALLNISSHLQKKALWS